jgi:AcrR family transcriptional regulator
MAEEPRERTALSRRRIVQEALRIVDAEGLRALTMRRLASELGVVPMALYYHVPNKAALYDGIVEAVMSEIDISVDDLAAPFDQRLKKAARAYREVLVAHPNALPVVADRSPNTTGALRPVETMLRILRDGGIPAADSLVAVNVVAALVQGAARMEVQDDLGTPQEGCSPEEQQARVAATLSPEEFPCLLEAASAVSEFSYEAQFEFGLNALVRGLTPPER